MKLKKFAKGLMLSTALLGMLVACDEQAVPSDFAPASSDVQSSDSVASSEEPTSQNYGSSEAPNSSAPTQSSTPSGGSSSAGDNSSTPSQGGDNEPTEITQDDLKEVIVNIIATAIGEEPIEGMDYAWDNDYEEYCGWIIFEVEETETLESYIQTIIETYVPAEFALTEEGVYQENWDDGSDGYFADMYSERGMWVSLGAWDNEDGSYGCQIEVYVDYQIGGDDVDPIGGDDVDPIGGDDDTDYEVSKADLKAVIVDIFTSAYGEAPEEGTDYIWDDDYEEYYGYVYFEVEEDDTLESILELVVMYCVPLEFDYYGDGIYTAQWTDGDDGAFVDLFYNGIWVSLGDWDDGDGYYGILVEVYSTAALAEDDDSDNGNTPIDIPEGGTKVSFMNPWGATTGADVSSLPAKLKDFINEKVGSNVVKNVTATASQVMKVDDVIKGDFCCLVIGSSKAGGELVISFNSTVKSVTLELETYGKTFIESKQQKVSIDTDSCVYVNGTKVDMSVTGETPKTETVAFEINSNTLTLSNNAAKQRVFVKSITFNF